MPYVNLNERQSWISDEDAKAFRTLRGRGVGSVIGADFHEPDQIDLGAVVQGRSFDNAGTEGEKKVVFKDTQTGKILGEVNLATLCALAMETVRENGLLK